MTETVSFSTTKDAWTEVASGSENVLVATNSRDSFLVHVAAAEPAAGAAGLEGTIDRTISLSSLVAGDKVFVRGIAADLPVIVLRS